MRETIKAMKRTTQYLKREGRCLIDVRNSMDRLRQKFTYTQGKRELEARFVTVTQNASQRE